MMIICAPPKGTSHRVKPPCLRHPKFAIVGLVRKPLLLPTLWVVLQRQICLRTILFSRWGQLATMAHCSSCPIPDPHSLTNRIVFPTLILYNLRSRSMKFDIPMCIRAPIYLETKCSNCQTPNKLSQACCRPIYWCVYSPSKTCLSASVLYFHVSLTPNCSSIRKLTSVSPSRDEVDWEAYSWSKRSTRRQKYSCSQMVHILGLQN